MDANLIQVTPPIIAEQLVTLKEKWSARVEEAKALECTEETLQTVKRDRAEMRKEFEEIETRRKEALAPIRAKLDAFSAVYKECVTDSYNAADAAYKGKIVETEGEIKRRCEKRCREYFTELRTVHGVDFVKYEYMHLKIDMTSAKQKTPKKLFDQINEWISKIANGMDKIDRSYPDDDERVEIMAEYKQCFDVGEAVTRVERRHRILEEERKAAEEREERRKREAEAVAKVEAAAPVLTPPVAVELPKEEKLLTATFKATATREKLIKLREFMKAEGIRYE